MSKTTAPGPPTPAADAARSIFRGLQAQSDPVAATIQCGERSLTPANSIGYRAGQLVLRTSLLLGGVRRL
jgi:hypothetical protein